MNDADKQLRNPECYKELTKDQTIAHANIINDTIEVFKTQHKIPDKITDGLKSHHPKTPTLRLPPKAHKEGRPARPLVSSINSHSTEISEYVDFHLQPHVLKIKSYIKDTNDFLNHLEKIPASTSRNSYLVTLDVRYLYSNIPNAEGIEVTKATLQREKSKLTSDCSLSMAYTYIK